METLGTHNQAFLFGFKKYRVTEVLNVLAKEYHVHDAGKNAACRSKLRAAATKPS